MKKIIVLAGRYEQFADYVGGLIKRLGDIPTNFRVELWNKFIYADCVEKVRGIEAEEVRVVGTFWDRPNARKLLEEAERQVR